MIRKRLSLGLIALGLLGGLAYASHWAFGEWQYRSLLADRALIAGDRDVTDKRDLTCPKPSDTLAFVIFGQSNAANHGGARLSSPGKVFDFYDGRCFEGSDPQFSATGKGGSPWPAFAAALREDGEARPILMSNVAVGNTAISEWQPGTKHAQFLQSETRALRGKGYRIAAFLFLQGESDRETPRAAYQTSLAKIADLTAALSPETPLIVADTSVCALYEGGSVPVPALSSARQALADQRAGVIVGPNTDTLGPAYRYDGCHFNRNGLERLGAMWADAVRAALD
jgi:hypothetical protein